MQRLSLVVKAWEAAGEPVLLHGPRGGLRVHPLFKVVQEQEKHAMRLRKGLSRSRMGRPPVAVIKPPQATALRNR